MTASQKRTLLTFLAVLLGSASQIPNLPPLAALVATSVAGFFAGWAHMDKPAEKVGT